MKTVFCAALVLACVGASAATVGADGTVVLTARLRGANETPPINTPATARFRAMIHEDGTIDFSLTYSDLSGPPSASHIHFAQRNVGGGVMIFLCGGDAQPACPTTTSGEIAGTITAANVVGPVAQGVNPGDLASALRIIIEQGEGYVNIHTSRFPGGEIRGQVAAHGGN